MFKRIRQFFKDVIAEFKRVQWPTRDATIKS
ncbi:MAG TPA: preprotein translocase subunit SecE, partial [Candidatus Lambdaproteobacteria bacterium]|nr:preprotein translocase subunit SecE [Candidatus Lambdaproteobacteria bacterium]